MGRVAALGCVVCRRLGYGRVPAEFHHIAEEGGQRSDFRGAPLCPDHHRGPLGIHGKGKEAAFVRRFKVPGLTEYGLLEWVNEDMQLEAMGRLA